MLFVRRQIKDKASPGGPQYFIQGSTRIFRDLSKFSNVWDVQIVSRAGVYESGLKLVTIEKGSVGKDRLHNQRGRYETIDKQVIDKFGLPFKPEDIWKIFFKIESVDKAGAKVTIRPAQVELLDGTTPKLWKGGKPTVVTIEPDPEDVAADIGEPPSKIQVTVSRVIRDTPKSKHLKRHYEHLCQVCRRPVFLVNKARYAETHHLRPLGGPHKGTDAWPNMIVVCPNHHAMLDKGAIFLLPKGGQVLVVDGTNKSQKFLGRLFLKPPHELATDSIDYHTENVYQGP